MVQKKSSLLIFWLSLFVFTTNVAADVITIVADEWMPYNGEPNSSEQGYGIDIAKHIFEAANHTVDYQIIPWKRALIQTKQGKYNAIIGLLKEEGPDFIFPQEEFGISENSFFVKKGSGNELWEFKGVESLLSVKVGIIKGYSYGEAINQFFGKNKNIAEYVHGIDPLSLNIKKLLAGRFDVTIEDANVFLQKAMKMGLSKQIVKVKSIGNTEDHRIYIALSPNNTKSKVYAEILTTGMRQLRASGELEKIMAKYGLKDWKQKAIH